MQAIRKIQYVISRSQVEDISIVFSREVFDMAKTLQLYSGSLRLLLSSETMLFLFYECDDVDFDLWHADPF